jgi:signal transduction histidine kinase
MENKPMSTEPTPSEAEEDLGVLQTLFDGLVRRPPPVRVRVRPAPPLEAFGGAPRDASSPQAASCLLSAFDLIARRGAGESSWAVPFGDDAIAFLLDTMSDAANLWSVEGSLLCRNRASIALGSISGAPDANGGPDTGIELFEAAGRHYERRYLRCHILATPYVLEIIRSRASSEPQRDDRPIPRVKPAMTTDEENLVTLAHELYGRLHVLAMNTDSMHEAARSVEAEAPRAWFLDRLDRQARTLRAMRQLMENLLEVRHAPRAHETSVQHVDLRTIVMDVLHSDGEALRAAHCNCSLVAPIPVLGRWDPLQLRLAIGNLVSNAVKYGAGRPVEISVGVRDESAFVCVADQGNGVLPEDRERIFERFERARTSPRSPGFGIGLWLVRNVARAHGGDVNLHSVPGQGAAFTLSLPRHRSMPRP